MKLKDYTIEEYIEKAEDKSSVPGGGSISALCGALSASLAMMVLKLSDQDEEVYAPFRECSSVLVDNIDADSASFDGVLRAFRMPKETREEVAIRSRAIQEGYIEAIEVPLKTMRAAEEILSLMTRRLDLMAKDAFSDVQIAGDLAMTAFRGAKSTALINIAALKDEGQKTAYLETLEALENRVDEHIAAIHAY
ncbi:MAG: cyclodeaminase/cyclohydrolase family protein [Peptoniphilus sp.]|nr:cyclodeaminase/cyclohydrolase family protein [Peptoniphilus sp.]MDY6044391.1 cyclodeaminase/cyclohydrolase family protein [Peptoniphilus sp.]